MADICIETRCNQNCCFCADDPGVVATHTPKDDELIELLKSEDDQSIIHVIGGEPTLSPRLPGLIALCHKFGRHLRLHTNGLRFADFEFTRRLAAIGLKEAFVSLHAPNATLSDAITRTPGAFKHTVQGIHHLRSAGVRVTISYVIYNANARRIRDFVQFVKAEFGAGMEVSFSFIRPLYKAWQSPVMIPRISDFILELKAALADGERFGLSCRIDEEDGLPLCFLRGFEKFSDAYRKIVEGSEFVEDPAKAKPEACRECLWYANCDGLWTRYIRRYGDDEIKPVLKLQEDVEVELKTVRHDERNNVRQQDTALTVGRFCQNDCIFCCEGGRYVKRSPMSLEEARELLDAQSPTEVFLSYGEPTTCDTLEDYIKLARQAGARDIVLVTNGSGLVDGGYAEKLLIAGVNEIRFSIHGSGAEMHDAHTRRPGSYDDIIEACKNLNCLRGSYPLRLMSLSVITSINVDHLSSLVSSLDDLGFDKIGLGVVEPVRSAMVNFDKIVPRYSHVARRVVELFAKSEMKGIDLSIDNLPPCLVPTDLEGLGRRSLLVTRNQTSGMVENAPPTRGKIFGDPCERCRLRGDCEGVWEGYIRRVGWDEFGLSEE